MQKLRARAVLDAKEHGNSSNDGTLKITRACVLTVTKEPCGCSALRRRRGAVVARMLTSDGVVDKRDQPTRVSCELRPTLAVRS